MRTERRPSIPGSFAAPLRTIPFLLLRPKLLLIALAPPAINLTIFLTLITTLSVTVTMPAVERVQQSTPFLSEGLSLLTAIVMSFLFIVLGGVLVLLLSGPLAAPFLDALTRRIEKEILGDKPELLAEDPPFISSVLHSIKEAIRRLLILATLVSVTFIISLTPVLGPPIAAMLVYLQAALFLSVDAFSYTLDRRGWTFTAKLHLLGRNPRLWLPLGAMQAILVLIPCSILFLPTLGAVAGTRVLCRHGRLRPELLNPSTALAPSPSSGAGSRNPDAPDHTP